MRPVSTFFDIQLSNSRAPFLRSVPSRSLAISFIIAILLCFKIVRLRIQSVPIIIPSLTVRKRKNRGIPCGYWAAAIFAVVTDYSILFFPFTFFLNISHFTFCYELIICSETTDVMKIIRNSFSFV